MCGGNSCTHRLTTTTPARHVCACCMYVHAVMLVCGFVLAWQRFYKDEDETPPEEDDMRVRAKPQYTKLVARRRFLARIGRGCLLRTKLSWVGLVPLVGCRWATSTRLAKPRRLSLLSEQRVILSLAIEHAGAPMAKSKCSDAIR